VEQGELDFGVPRPVEEVLVEGPGIRADRLGVADPGVYCHLVASSVKNFRSGSAVFSDRSSQYALTGFQKLLSIPSS
jgi:hypothetical protein